MSENIQSTTGASGPRSGIAAQSRASWAVVIAFALGFGYAVVRGSILLVSNVQFFGAEMSGTGWFVLIGAICVPVLIFGLCLLVARRLSALSKAIVFLVGSTAVAALTLSLYSLTVVVFIQG